MCILLFVCERCKILRFVLTPDQRIFSTGLQYTCCVEAFETRKGPSSTCLQSLSTPVWNVNSSPSPSEVTTDAEFVLEL